MSGAEVRLPVTVEFEDVDSYGIAHHTRLIAFLERARVRLLAEGGIDVPPAGPVPVLRRLDTRFRKPARMLDVLTVSARAEATDGVILDLRYEIRRGDDLVLKAESEIAFSDPRTGGAAPVPAELLVRLGL